MSYSDEWHAVWKIELRQAFAFSSPLAQAKVIDVTEPVPLPPSRKDRSATDA